MNSAHAPPVSGRHFYTLLPRADGRADVYLEAQVYPKTTEDGQTDYDIRFKVARDICPEDFKPSLEEHIREHYGDWCDIAEVVWM